MSRRPRMRRLVSDARGAAYVEFLLAFIPLFILFLGMTQMSLMYAGDLVVQHAASRAARAAVVVLDDDPEYYGGQERLSISGPGVASTEDAIGAILRVFGGGGGGGSSGMSATGGERMAAIRTAASVPMMAISPSMDQLVGDESVRMAIGNPEGRAASSLLYNEAAMAVTFPDAPGGTSYRTEFDEGQQITARVTYLFHCGVPLANRLMCETYPNLRLGPGAAIAQQILDGLADGTMTFDEAMERLQRVNESQRRQQRDQPGINELEAAGADDLMYLTWATGSRFKVLRGEATMPLQYARYYYPSE
jgi:hypothetical protein